MHASLGTWLGAKLSAIGVDIGSHSIKAAQLRRVGERWHAAQLACFPRIAPKSPVDETEIRRLLGVLHRQGFLGRKLVVAMPAEKTLTGTLDLPAAVPGVPIDDIARQEFARMHNHDAKELQLSYWELPATSRTTRGSAVLATGCLVSDSQSFLDIVESSGLCAEAMDAQASALVRPFVNQMSGDEGDSLQVVMDLGWSGSLLAVLLHNVLVYERRVSDIALAPLFEALNQATSEEGGLIDDLVHTLAPTPNGQTNAHPLAEHQGLIAEYFRQVADELRLCGSYVTHRYPQARVKSIHFAGGGASFTHLGPYIKDLLQVDAGASDLRKLIACDRIPVANISPLLVTAVGLSQFQPGD